MIGVVVAAVAATTEAGTNRTASKTSFIASMIPCGSTSRSRTASDSR
jgi:hypothetical protein